MWCPSFWEASSVSWSPSSSLKTTTSSAWNRSRCWTRLKMATRVSPRWAQSGQVHMLGFRQDRQIGLSMYQKFGTGCNIVSMQQHTYVVMLRPLSRKRLSSFTLTSPIGFLRHVVLNVLSACILSSLSQYSFCTFVYIYCTTVLANMFAVVQWMYIHISHHCDLLALVGMHCDQMKVSKQQVALIKCIIVSCRTSYGGY